MADGGMKESLTDLVNEYLIELVHVRPVLYAKSHKNYTGSRMIKRNNWDEIAKEMAKEDNSLTTASFP